MAGDLERLITILKLQVSPTTMAYFCLQIVRWDTSTTTNTGHTLQDNPFAVIDMVGKNDEFLMELIKDNHQEYKWLDITEFNTTAWQGNDTIEIQLSCSP